MASSRVNYCAVEIHGCFEGLAHQLRSGTTAGASVTLNWPPGSPQSWRLPSAPPVHTFSWGKLSSTGHLAPELSFFPGELLWEVYGQSWVVDLHFGWDSTYGFQAFKKVSLTSQHSRTAWSTIVIGKVNDVLGLSEESGVKDSLVFKIVAFPDTWTALSMVHELEGLKKSMKRLQSTITTLKEPSIDITRLVFHSKGRTTVRHLYVLSDLLTKYEYFQSCHSGEYSETQQQSSIKLNEEAGPPQEELEFDDSDDEWDIEGEYTEKPNSTFKATIHVKGTSRRTYQAFIDYSLCGALYFAPPRISYNLLTAQQKSTPWPVWAENHKTTHIDVPGIKTLTSAKCLYRMADMLSVPELTAICRDQIVTSFKVENVVDMICSPLFQQHTELRLEAYGFIRKNRDQIVKTDQFPRMVTELSATEARLFWTEIFQETSIS